MLARDPHSLVAQLQSFAVLALPAPPHREDMQRQRLATRIAHRPPDEKRTAEVLLRGVELPADRMHVAADVQRPRQLRLRPEGLRDLDGFSCPLECRREVLQPLQGRGGLNQRACFRRAVLDLPGQFNERLGFRARAAELAYAEEDVGARTVNAHEDRHGDALAKSAGGLYRLSVEVDCLAQSERL